MKWILIVWSYTGHVGNIPTFAVFNTKAACEIVLKEALSGTIVRKDSKCLEIRD